QVVEQAWKRDRKGDTEHPAGIRGRVVGGHAAQSIGTANYRRSGQGAIAGHSCRISSQSAASACPQRRTTLIHTACGQLCALSVGKCAQARCHKPPGWVGEKSAKGCLPSRFNNLAVKHCRNDRLEFPESRFRQDLRALCKTFHECKAPSHGLRGALAGKSNPWTRGCAGMIGPMTSPSP